MEINEKDVRQAIHEISENATHYQELMNLLQTYTARSGFGIWKGKSHIWYAQGMSYPLKRKFDTFEELFKFALDELIRRAKEEPTPEEGKPNV